MLHQKYQKYQKTLVVLNVFVWSSTRITFFCVVFVWDVFRVISVTSSHFCAGSRGGERSCPTVHLNWFKAIIWEYLREGFFFFFSEPIFETLWDGVSVISWIRISQSYLNRRKGLWIFVTFVFVDHYYFSDPFCCYILIVVMVFVWFSL